MAIGRTAGSTKAISFKEAKEIFVAHHDLDEGTNRYALDSLIAANEEADGYWARRDLEYDEIMGIVLPPHAHRSSSGRRVKPLVHRPGIVLADILQALSDDPKPYRARNICAKALRIASEDLRPIFLCRWPINISDHQGLESFSGEHLYHLDGLHRLIGRGMMDLYSQSYLSEFPVQAFIAGE